MKRFLLALSIIAALAIYNIDGAKAQSVSVNINIGKQPAWGPVGYNYVGYYYFPDIDIYYSVDRSFFFYWDGRGWVGAPYLPPRYAHYDLYRMYKVVINDHDPWRYNSYHRTNYAHYRGNSNQIIILNSRDHRYRNSRNNRVAWVDSKYSSGRYSAGRTDYNSYSSRSEGRNTNHRNDRYSDSRSSQSTPSGRKPSGSDYRSSDPGRSSSSNSGRSSSSNSERRSSGSERSSSSNSGRSSSDSGRSSSRR